jgi:hypothetical protein
MTDNSAKIQALIVLILIVLYLIIIKNYVAPHTVDCNLWCDEIIIHTLRFVTLRSNTIKIFYICCLHQRM